MTLRVLVPFDLRECLTIEQASKLAGRSTETLRKWCERYVIGRRIGGRWAVSFPALLMHLENDRRALALYHSGQRQSPLVSAYFERAALLRPTQPHARACS